MRNDIGMKFGPIATVSTMSMSRLAEEEEEEKQQQWKNNKREKGKRWAIGASFFPSISYGPKCKIKKLRDEKFIPLVLNLKVVTLTQ